MKQAKSAKKAIFHGIGRRKSAVARIWIKPGSGAITVNGKGFEDYFFAKTMSLDASTPLQLVSGSPSFDIAANIQGGGLYAQAGAMRLGIARALLNYDDRLRSTLRQHGLLTVDSRVKERKKYGQRAARRRFQFVKR